MPQMSGPELAIRTTTVRPSLKVLYMSGLMGKTVVYEGAVVPDAVVLHKPFTAEDLARKVREVLGEPG